MVVAAVAIVAFFIATMPRAYTRQLRHRLAEGVVWQWIKGSKLSANIHTWLWSDGNGSMIDRIPRDDATTDK